MIEVYKLTAKQVTDWSGKYGVDEFRPMKDVNNNWITGLENANNPAFPFTGHLKTCPQITYNPKVVPI